LSLSKFKSEILIIGESHDTVHHSRCPADAINVTQAVGIKSGSGMSNASLNGTYAMVSQSIGFHTYSSNTGTKTAYVRLY
jgi:hypothetical protein